MRPGPITFHLEMGVKFIKDTEGGICGKPVIWRQIENIGKKVNLTIPPVMPRRFLQNKRRVASSQKQIGNTVEVLSNRLI